LVGRLVEEFMDVHTSNAVMPIANAKTTKIPRARRTIFKPRDILDEDDGSDESSPDSRLSWLAEPLVLELSGLEAGSGVPEFELSAKPTMSIPAGSGSFAGGRAAPGGIDEPGGICGPPGGRTPPSNRVPTKRAPQFGQLLIGGGAAP
jgi:hypothetical protein